MAEGKGGLPTTSPLASASASSSDAVDRSMALNGVAWFLFNFVSSVGVVYFNKTLFQTYGFNYSSTLTAIHFAVTGALLYGCSLFGMFERKAISIVQVLPVSLALCGSIVFNNISLQINSVSVYQISKVSNAVVTVVIERLLYNKDYPWPVKLSLIPIILGTALATVSDFGFSGAGVIVAILAIITTSIYTIWVGKYQADLQVDSMQLLLYQAPLSAVLLLPVIPLFDSVPGLVEFECLTAFGVNLSMFYIVGKFSALTFMVVGNLKTCAVLAMGFLVFEGMPTVEKIIGLLISLAGVTAYSYFKAKK